jgi:mRNA interferase RelE/StbE
MNWELDYLPEALEDLKKMDNSIRKQVLKGMEKVRINPLPKDEGGYGTPLGNIGGNNLTGLMKIKFKKYGIRVVYAIERKDKVMKVIVVSARAENKVYDKAGERRITNNL